MATRRPTWRPGISWTANATTGLRPVAVFAAVAAVLLIGAGSVVLFGGGPGATSGPTAPATAGQTTKPPASQGPTPVAVPPLPGNGQVDAGTYRVEFPDSPVSVDLTVGDGWTAGNSFTEEGFSAPWNVQYLMNPPFFTHAISFYTVGNVNTDGCDWEGTQPDPPIGPSVDDFIAALDAQENTDMSAPVDVVLDGCAGKRVEMRIADSTQCLPAVMWVRPNGELGHPLGGDGSTDYITVWALDVDGHRVVIDTAVNRLYEDDPDVRAEVMAVMDSMTFAVN